VNIVQSYINRSGINASVKFTLHHSDNSLSFKQNIDLVWDTFTLQNYICFASHPSAKNSRAIYFRERNLLVPVARADRRLYLAAENQIAFLSETFINFWLYLRKFLSIWDRIVSTTAEFAKNFHQWPSPFRNQNPVVQNFKNFITILLIIHHLNTLKGDKQFS
jgi:hypothetical protein